MCGWKRTAHFVWPSAFGRQVHLASGVAQWNEGWVRCSDLGPYRLLFRPVLAFLEVLDTVSDNQMKTCLPLWHLCVRPLTDHFDEPPVDEP